MQGANSFKIKFCILITKNVIIRMNLKQFLKPNWRKILILVIFILLFLLDNYITNPFEEHLSKSSWLSSLHSILWYPYTFLTLPLFAFTMPITGIMFIIFLLIIIIYWYLLSCFIVWLYDKFKKKK